MSTPAVAVPVRFLTEFHDSAHARKLDSVVTVVLVERGRGIVIDGQGTQETRTGDVVVFAPEAEFRYVPIRPQRISMMLVEEGMLLDALAWRHAPHSDTARARVRAAIAASPYRIVVLHPSASEARRLSRLMHAARDLQQSHAGVPAREEVPQLLSWFAEILKILDPQVMRDHPDPSYAAQIFTAAAATLPSVRHPGVQRALEFLAKTPPMAWTLTAMAGQASLSPGHFSHVFTAEVGTSPRQFLSERRLSEFAMLVQTTTLTVSQAARRVGWSSTSHAIAAFRHRFGVTPLEYRSGVRRDAVESMIVPDERLILPSLVEGDLD